MRKSLVIGVLVCWVLLHGFSGFAQSGIRALVVNEASNVRITPAIGSEVIGSAPSGYVFEFVNARSADGQWLRVDFNGNEGWVNITPLVILQGDINSLPVADPRSIPYGGFESPRAGQTNRVSPDIARVTNGLRIRNGPSQGYPTIGNLFANTLVSVYGRTASNNWIQVSHNGILGWVNSGFLEFQNGLQITSLPIDGIVADAPAIPLEGSTGSEYFDVLKLFLARIDLAQPSLDNIRAKWTDAALVGRAVCRDYPARPSDYVVPQPVLAANYGQLNPIQEVFNLAMADLRQAIDLFIEICNLPGTGNPVGQGAASNALALVARIDQRFADLRDKLRELIPPDLEPGPNECLLIYRQKAEILGVIQTGQIYRQFLAPNDRAVGFCFDALAGQTFAVELLRISGNVAPIIAISSFDNPTNILIVGRGSTSGGLTLAQPLIIPQNGRYLVLIYDAGGGSEPPQGEFAFALVPIINGITQLLAYNADTDTVTLSGVPGIQPTATGLNNTSSGLPNSSSAGGAAPVACPSITYTCDQLFTCQEAFACLASGNLSLDPDGNGKPCPNLCGP
ncbi:MAG: SH3 domain-containing protein [Anaerolineae bacterium]|nr:SH3 domain-containing protein [Anaerolineae bacterium]